MKAWLISHGQACRRAIRRLLSQPTVTLLSVLVIGIAITLPLGLYVTFANVSAAASRVNTEPNVNVYLALNASEQEAREVERKLKLLANVDVVTFISRETALTEMKRVENLSDLLSSLKPIRCHTHSPFVPKPATPKHLPRCKKKSPRCRRSKSLRWISRGRKN